MGNDKPEDIVLSIGSLLLSMVSPKKTGRGGITDAWHSGMASISLLP